MEIEAQAHATRRELERRASVNDELLARGARGARAAAEDVHRADLQRVRAGELDHVDGRSGASVAAPSAASVAAPPATAAAAAPAAAAGRGRVVRVAHARQRVARGHLCARPPATFA